MRAVWKYELPRAPEFTLDLPVAASVVHVASQGEQPCVWVVFTRDPETGLHTSPRKFFQVTTGEAFPDHAEYRGTYLLDDGAFVGHVLEEVL